MLTIKDSKTITGPEKIEFFFTCQKILLQYHPNSEYVLREDNLNASVAKFASMIRQYQGLWAFDDNVCILHNRIYVADPTDPVLALKSNLWKPPQTHYNGISIDFVVFREIKDCFEFIQSQYNQNIKHILFVRDGKPRIYDALSLISKVIGARKESTSSPLVS